MKRTHVILLLTAATLTLNAQVPNLDTLKVKIGYSQGNQRTSAGAIDKLGSERMSKGLIISSIDAISGQAAGVQVQSAVNQEAMVSAVRVRGTTSLTGGNDPLVIIDGVTANLSTLSTIYPADIESFTILKDAAETAQYGSQGAAGVIDVTTKKGRGGKFHIAYDGNIGFQSVYKNVDMLSGDEFRQVARQRGIVISDGGTSTDFHDAISRTGFVHNHHVAFGGGTEASNYRTSIGLMDHQTVIRTNRLRNYIAKLDISQKAFDNRLTVDLGLFASIQKSNQLPFQSKLFYSADTFNPTMPAGRNEKGEYADVPEAIWISNPTAMLDMVEDEEVGHFNAHLRAKVDIGYGILLTAFGSYSYNTYNNAHFYPTYTWNGGEAYRADLRNEHLLGHLKLEKTIHIDRQQHVSLLGLIEFQDTESRGFNVTTTRLVSNDYGYDNISAGAVRLWGGTDSYLENSSMRSYMLRAKYTLRDRYSLTVNARNDGSSKVGSNNHYGFFPSVAVAWIISEEPWMKGLKWLNDLKLRLGVGRSGNLGGIGSYNSLLLVQPNGVVNVGGNVATTIGISRNANPDLSWEIKTTMNVGLNASFWDKRITLSADLYRSKTTDLLYQYEVPVPPYPYDKLLANLGEIEAEGLEIGFGITPLKTRDLTLSLNANMTFESNRLISLNGWHNGQYLVAPSIKGIAGLSGAGFHGGSDVTMQIVGEQLGVFFLPHCNGLVQQADGSYKYDVSGDRQICGQATPKMRLGSNIAVRYRQWDLCMQMNGAFGHKIFNGTALTYMNMQMMPNYNVMKEAPEQNIQDQTISDYWLERGDYVNFDYVTLGWTVPLQSRYVQHLRVSASVNNLATITGYSGLTPMINSSIVNSTLGVDDKRTYPVYRSFSFGLSMQF